MELKRQLHYDPDTGIFTRLIVNNTRWKVGDIAGHLNKAGYIVIGINGKTYPAQRLAHLYTEGYFPEHDMDHKFGIKDDNRWKKLRHATRICNMQNQAIRSDNTSGFPGVYKRGKRWRVMMVINGKFYRIGNYDDSLEAALARFTAEVWCPQWTYNYRSELVKAIKAAWLEFNPNN